MKIVTAAEMREIDRLTTEQYGVPSLTLMENAGAAVADFARKHFDFNSVCVVCGKGNNGGDGFVTARKLQEAGTQVSLLVLAAGPEELQGDAAEMFKRLQMQPFWISNEDGLRRPDVQQALRAELIIDAILGTGFKPPIRGVAEKAVQAINGASAPVLAVDVPSGIDADSLFARKDDQIFVKADAIVSFTAPKPALVYETLTEGPIGVAEIGSPVNLVVARAELNQDVLTAREAWELHRKREPDSHKGDFGHVLVVGGSMGKSGAAAMAGIAALRSGAGLVTVACPKSVQPMVAASAPELMTEALEETSEGSIALLALRRREELLKGKTVVVVGPGLSRNEETAEFIRDFIGICSVHLVIDADGLNAFAGRAEELQPDNEIEPGAVRVLTPHPGEMGRLLDIDSFEVQRSRIRMTLRAATHAHATVVLKGYRTVIATPGGYVWVNCSGNPGMAKGGSGDVLSGILGGILAQNPHIPGSLFWTADLTPEHDIESISLQGIFNRVARGEGQSEARRLAEEFKKTSDPELRKKALQQLPKIADQFIALLGSLHVARGVYLHGLAGDLARDLYGEDSMIATDIIQCLGEAFSVCEQESHGKFQYIQR